MGEVIAFRGRRTSRSGQPLAGNSARASPARREPLWREVAGSVLRDERRRQQRTLAHVAGRAGMSVQYLSELERGRKEASSEMLGRRLRRTRARSRRVRPALRPIDHLGHRSAEPGPSCLPPDALRPSGVELSALSGPPRLVSGWARHGQLPAGDDVVGQPVVHRLRGGEDLVPVGVGAQRRDVLPGVPAEDLLHLRAHPERSPWPAGPGPAACPARRADGWCSTTRACGSSVRRPGAPPASSTAAADAAWPTQVVATGARTNCIVS